MGEIVLDIVCLLLGGVFCGLLVGAVWRSKLRR